MGSRTGGKTSAHRRGDGEAKGQGIPDAPYGYIPHVLGNTGYHNRRFHIQLIYEPAKT